MKRIGAILLMALMITSLTGCGNKKTVSSTVSNINSAANSVVSETTSFVESNDEAIISGDNISSMESKDNSTLESSEIASDVKSEDASVAAE